MNLKKVSIFIDNWLRKRLADADSEPLAKAFGHAALFAPMVVQLLSTNPHPLRMEDLPPMLQSVYKDFCAGYAEAYWLADAFNESARVEAALTVWAEGVVRVEVFFYQRSLKEPHYTLSVGVDSEGKVTGFGSAIRKVSV
jgi:hypothetical protein